MKTAKIYHFPQDFPVDAVPPVPSLMSMVCTLKCNHFDELTENQKKLIYIAEQAALTGQEAPAHYRSVHQIFVKVRTATTLDRIKEFCRRFK